MIKTKDEQKKLMELFFIKYENGNIPEKINITIDQFKEVVKDFQKLTKDRVEIEKRGNYISIYTLTGSIDIRLRSDLAPYLTLVIAGFSFETLNQATASKFLIWLKDFSRKNGFQRLMVENCHSDRSIEFAMEHGFLPLYQQSILDTDFGIGQSFEIYLDEELVQEIR